MGPNLRADGGLYRGTLAGGPSTRNHPATSLWAVQFSWDREHAVTERMVATTMVLLLIY